MPYARLVQIGRVCLINYGPDAGKLAVIVDIVDENRAVVAGPADSSLHRQAISFKRLSLTEIKIDLLRGARTKQLTAAYKAADVDGKWNSSAWAKKLAAKELRAK